MGNPNGKPRTIYHYTDTPAMISILTGATLWATDIFYLNDSLELMYGREEMVAGIRAMADRLDSGAGETAEERAQNSRKLRLEVAATALEDRSKAAIQEGPFIVCFCEERDLLSQWRGYAGGAGWAIGFDQGKLETLVKNEGARQGRSTLFPVSYGRQAIESALANVRRQLDDGPKNHPGVAGVHDASLICELELAKIKHEAFLEEREWRLVALGGFGQIGENYRAGSCGLTPYLPLEFPRSAVNEIIVGPSRFPDLQMRSAWRMLRRLGYNFGGADDVTVSLSCAPFRG